MDMNDLACACQNITWQQIKDAYDRGADTYEEMQKATGCGIGCELCVDTITDYINSLRYENQKG